MLTGSGFDAADELKLPVVANLPGPVGILEMFSTVFPNNKNTSTCCGLLCVRKTIHTGIMAFVIPKIFNNPNLTKNL
jgi:hypothetical protein